MLSGSVLQISISRGGVPKYAVPEGDVTPLGIAGDAHAHPQIHGGPRQAILLLSSETIEELKILGYPVYPGALGENITTLGIDRREWRAGQRWRIGPEVIVELTKVRGPCDQLSVYGPGIQNAIYNAKVKAGDPSSTAWAMSGFYASVIRPGIIRPGDSISLLGQLV